ncbi:hypothetical protein T01_5460, partial [Trichinella spiralis]
LSTHSVKALSDDLDAGLETRSTINYDNTVNASQEVVGTLIEVHKEDDSELNICSFRGLERTCHLLVLEMPYFYAPVFRITNEMTVLEMEANERWRQRSEYWRYFSFLCFSSTITAISQLYLVIILVLHNFLFILCRYSIYVKTSRME